MIEKVKEFENEILKLNDLDLLEKLKHFFVKEKKIGDAILICLKEIKCRRLFNLLGYSSLFEMLVKYYSLSESGAVQRLNALKLIEAVPDAQDFLVNGIVSLNTLSEAQTHINKIEKTTGIKMSLIEKSQLVEEIKDKSVRETRNLLAEKNPELNLPEDKERKITNQLTLVQMKLDQETMELLNELKNLVSHQIVDGNWNELMKTMAQTTLLHLKKKKGLVVNNNVDSNLKTDVDKTDAETHEKTEFQKLKPDLTYLKNTSVETNEHKLVENKSNVKNNSLPNFETLNTTSQPTSKLLCETKRSRYIPRAIRRKAFERAGFQCQFIAVNGHRCQSRHQLEVNHIKAFSKGGTHDLDSLNILCKNHNLYYTKKTHGYFYNPAINKN